MVDFVKVLVESENVPANITSNYGLNFTEAINADTGELKEGSNSREATYKNLKLKLYYSGNLLITGSLHKYFNNGHHNFNDFCYQDLVSVLKDLSNRFDLDLEKCTLQNIEFGLNIIPPIPAKTLIKNVMLYRSKPFKYVSIRNSDYKQVEQMRNILKAYDKGYQYRQRGYNISMEILRFEDKFRKMLSLNNLNIYCLNDLFDKVKLRLALEMLIERFDKLVIYDPTLKLSELSEYNRKIKRYKFMNPNWWLDLSPNHRSNELKVFRNLVKMYSNNIQSETSNLLRQKTNQLLNNCVFLTQELEGVKSEHSNTLYIGKEHSLIASHFNITNLVEKRLRIAS